LNVDFPLLLHHTVCGGLAAAGLGVLFNVGFRALSWCAASGALMLAVRTVALGFGCSMEAASFAAALAGGIVVQLLPSPVGVSRLRSRSAVSLLTCSKNSLTPNGTPS